jgi:hypothetical protein
MVSRSMPSSGRMTVFTQSGNETPGPFGCTNCRVLSVEVATAVNCAALERQARWQLEHTLRDELGQELAGISLMLGALTQPSTTATPERDALLLLRVAGLVRAAIGHCIIPPSGTAPC